MLWIINLLLGFGLTLLAINRDIPRVKAHLEDTYNYSNRLSHRYAILISSLIFFPVFGYFMLAVWVSETHRLNEFGFCCLLLAAPLWWYLGYLFTGGNPKRSQLISLTLMVSKVDKRQPPQLRAWFRHNIVKLVNNQPTGDYWDDGSLNVLLPQGMWVSSCWRKFIPSKSDCSCLESYSVSGASIHRCLFLG